MVSEWTEIGVIQELMIEDEGVAFTGVVGERVYVNKLHRVWYMHLER